MEKEVPYKIIFRVEIDTLLDEAGHLNKQRMEHLAMVCTNLQNAGFKVLVVTSGAIVLGSKKMGLPAPPTELISKQAVASIGQADLIKYYQTFFNTFDQSVAQILITRDVAKHRKWYNNARKTLLKLLEKDIIPVINENDAVSVDDIILNDNYPLTLIIARLVKPNAIIIPTMSPNKYKLMIKNDPEILEMNENDMFSIADMIKTGKKISEKINFDCRNAENLNPFRKSDSIPGEIEFHETGFPLKLDVNIYESTTE